MAKTLVGTVVSDKPQKSIVVSVQSTKIHPLYRKRYVLNKKFLAHDEKDEAKEGDKVTIRETRPISARKRFVLESILEKAAIKHVEPEPEVAKPKKVEKPDEATVLVEKKVSTRKTTGKKSDDKEAEA